MAILVFEFMILLFLIVFCFWLISMMISTLTAAPFVVSNDRSILEAIKLAKPKDGDVVYDLGSGDGRTLRLFAGQANIKGVGFEISPYCYLVAQLKNLFYHLDDKIEIRYQSLFSADFSKPDIIFLYLTNKILNKLEKSLFDDIKPDCRIVNLAFPFRNHQPTKSIDTRQLGRPTKLYLYSKN